MSEIDELLLAAETLAETDRAEQLIREARQLELADAEVLE